MKNPKQAAIMAFVLLFVALALGMFFRQPAVVQQPVLAVDPVPSNPTQAVDEHQHGGAMEEPSPEIIQAIREIRKPTLNEGQVIKNPDGSAKMNMGNRLQSVPIATIDKDGKIHVDYHGEKYLESNKK